MKIKILWKEKSEIAVPRKILIPRKKPSGSSSIFTGLLVGLITAGLFSATLFVFATPPDSQYSPGDTLDPACTPGSTNCTVTSPVSSSVTTLSSLVSIGTITTGVWNGTAIDVAHGGTGLASGTSGGIPYFSSTSALSSSSLLAQYKLMVGGGAGAAPATLSSAGTANQVLVSGGSSANPTWSTATYPATTTANQVLYSSAANTVGGNANLTFNGTTLTAGGLTTTGTATVGELAFSATGDIPASATMRYDGTNWIFYIPSNHMIAFKAQGVGAYYDRFSFYETGNFSASGNVSAGSFSTSGSISTETLTASGIVSSASSFSNSSYSNSVFLAGAGAAGMVTDNNIFAGYQAGLSTTTGGDNIFMGYKAGYSNESGSNDIFIGQNAGYNQTAGNLLIIDQGVVSTGAARADIAAEQANSLIYGTFADAAANQALVVNAGTVKMPSVTTGGSGTVDLLIDANGQLWKGASSLRYKHDVQDFSDDFSKILQVQPKSFVYNNGGPDIGYIAEDLDAVGLTNLVNYDKEGRPDSIKYDKIPLYLLEVIKQQQVDIDSLKLSVGLNGAGSAGSGYVSNLNISSNALVQGVSQLLSTMGITIQNGITYIKNLSADKLTARTARVSEGIEMTDKATGEIYCTWILNGEWQKQKGDCATVFATLPAATLAQAGPETAKAPATESQILETAQVVQQTAQVVQQVVKAQQAPEKANQAAEKANQAAKEAKQAANEAKEATQEVQQIIQQAKEEQISQTQEQPVQEEQQQPVQEEQPVGEEQPEEQPAPVEVDTEAGELIEDAASSLLNGIWDFLKLFSEILGRKLSSLEIAQNASAGILKNSEILKEGLFSKEAKIFSAGLIEPIRNLFAK